MNITSQCVKLLIELQRLFAFSLEILYATLRKVLQKIYKKNFEIHLSLFCYWAFWHDVTAAILVYQEDPLEVEIFFM